MTKEVLFIIGPIVAALLTWALQKVYSNVMDKIAIQKDITKIRINSLDTYHAAKRVEEKTGALTKSIDDMLEAIKKVDERVTVTEDRSKLQAKAMATLIIDYKQRKE